MDFETCFYSFFISHQFDYQSSMVTNYNSDCSTVNYLKYSDDKIQFGEYEFEEDELDLISLNLLLNLTKS